MSKMPSQQTVLVVEDDKMMIVPKTVSSWTPSSHHEDVARPLASATAICDREVDLKCKTFKLTISVKGDISDACVKQVLKCLRKFKQKFVVLERGNSNRLHLHALLHSDEPRHKRNIQTVVAKIVKRCHPDSNSRAVMVNVCSDTEWYDEYLRKESDHVDVDTANFDIGQFRNDLPDETTQNALQAAQGQRPNHNVLLAHEERWIKYAPDDRSYVSAIKYLKWRQNVVRDMQPIIDLRRFRQLAYCLCDFRNKNIEPDAGDHAFYNKEFAGEVPVYTSNNC